MSRKLKTNRLRITAGPIVVVVFLTVIMLCVTTHSSSPVLPPTGTPVGSVTRLIEVRDADTGLAIEGADIAIEPLLNISSQTYAVTDINGQATISVDTVDEGEMLTFTISFQNAGYQPLVLETNLDSLPGVVYLNYYSTATVIPVATTPLDTILSFETTDNPNISQTDVLGDLNVEYPMRMSPESSDTVILSIYIPTALVNLKPMSVERIQIPDDIPAIIGELNSYQTTILVTEIMRAELSSPGLEIVESLHASQQYVNIQEVNKPTSWAWTIRAPNALGRQVFTLKIYLNQDINPAWVGSFYVEVVEPSPTPKPTETPLPLLSRVANQLIENSTTVFGAILTFIAAMAGIYAQYNKTKDKIDKLQEKISEISKREEEHETLNREIAHLKSIKWWQFWRR